MLISRLFGTLVIAQVFCMCAAAFFWFRQNGNTLSESASYAIITVFMLLSFIHQISFIAGYPVISTGMTAFFMIFSSILIFRHHAYIFSLWNTINHFKSSNPISFTFLGVCFLYMAMHSLFPVPKEFQNELYTLALYEKTGFFPLGADPEFPGFPPVNHLILFNTFQWVGSSVGAGIFCFLAYLSIGFSTYALARRYSWQTTAFTTAVLVMSMPRLVIQALYPGTQIISVAVVLFCLLAIYRSVEVPTLMDLILLILGLFFCISENISSMIFAPILFVLSCVVLVRRHGIITWKSILKKNPHALFAVVPGVIFSQSWLFLSNHLNKGTWAGIFSIIPLNSHGIKGALANFIRYFFESVNFAVPIDIFFKKIFHWSMAENLESLFDFSIRPFLGESGAVQVFHLAWQPTGIISFGPAGCFLVIPALLYALMKGPRRLKSVATAFFVYFYLISLIMAWAPGNAKFLEIFYVCSGFSIAFFLPPWRFTKTNKKILQAGGCCLLLLTLLAAS